MSPAGEFEWQGRRIPSHMQAGLRRYLKDHIRPGAFLLAVLRNDLARSVAAADGDNLSALPVYVAYLTQHAPPESWGSPDKVKAWLSWGPST